MKQIPILSGKAHVVELPEGAIEPRITQPFGIYLTFNDRFGFNRIKLPPGNWRIIGMLSEVTEEQAAGMAPLIDPDDASYGFERFMSDEQFSRVDRVEACQTALESLESAISAEGYTFTNSLGNEKEYKKKYKGHPMFFANHMAKWFEAQSRVLCRGRCLVLRRTDKRDS